MNILVCNDDGYLAEGIAVLARVAGELPMCAWWRLSATAAA